MASPLTKPGKHGQLHLYAITYTDRSDPACPHFVTRLWAYSWEHAEERFYDTDDDGWTILAWSRVTDAPAHRWTVHEVKR